MAAVHQEHLQLIIGMEIFHGFNLLIYQKGNCQISNLEKGYLNRV